MSDNHCPACQHANPAASNFCNHCGQRLAVEAADSPVAATGESMPVEPSEFDWLSQPDVHLPIAGDDLTAWFNDERLGSEPADEEASPPPPAGEASEAEAQQWLQAVQESDPLVLKIGPAAADNQDDALPSEPAATLPAELFASGPNTEPVIFQAEIPAWLQRLKPPEMSDHSPSPAFRRVGQDGERGERDEPTVIAIEPVIARPRAGGQLSAFTVTKDQEEKVALLRRLVQAGTHSGVVMPEPPPLLSDRARLILSLALVLVIWLGIRGNGSGGLAADGRPSARSSQQQAALLQSPLSPALEAAAGRPVLVAFDYTPALAAELNPIAEALLAALERNGSPIVAVSQVAAGATLAAQLTGGRAHLIVGEAMGLRRLGGCLNENTPCPFNLTETAPDSPIPALVIILTGDHDSLVNWIEQVGTQGHAPLAAGTTRALAPVAAPYYESGQLRALFVGTLLPDAEAADTEDAVALGIALVVVVFAGLALYTSGNAGRRRRPS